MEGNVVSSYLRSKFSSTLEETEADLRGSSQIISRFRSIERLIYTTKQNSGTMEDLLHDLMEALSDYRIFALEAAGFNLFRVVRFKNKMKRRLDKIEKSLRDGRDQYHNRTSVVAMLQACPYFPDLSLIKGFESQVREVEEMLVPVDSGFTPIGIVGRCGSGKTALAQMVFASCVVEKMFFPRIWVGLSKSLFDEEPLDLRETILNHILVETGHDIKELEYGDFSVVKLLEKMSLRLRGKRYLIVLDDAWRMDEWFDDLACTGEPKAESFTRGLPKGSGGAVIVTSRGENVIRRMVGEKHVIRPQLSDKNVIWTIFSDAVRQQEKIDPDHEMLIGMKDSIINTCEGLPLAENN